MEAPAAASPRVSGKIRATEVRHEAPASRGTLERLGGGDARDPSTGATGGETLSLTSEVIDAGQRFDYVGVHWRPAVNRAETVFLELRTSSDGTTWSEWIALFEEEDMADIESGERYAPPLAVGDARYAQYRVHFTDGDVDAARHVALTLMDVSDLNAAPLARLLNDLRGAAQDLASSFTAHAATAPVRIYARADWVADESLMQWTPQYVPWKKAVVHHTVTTNSYSSATSEIRAIYYYHAVTRGWGDIGYSFLVDKYGNVWTGRQGGDDVVGGHAYGWNDGSLGVAALGTFTTSAPPPSMLQGIANIIALKFAQRGIQPFGSDVFTHKEEDRSGNWVQITTSPPNVLGHRDCAYVIGVAGGQTSCPGGALYNLLNTIRNSAQALVNGGFTNLAHYTTSLPRVATTAQTLTVPVTVKNAGRTTIPASSTRLSYRLINPKTGGVFVSQGPLASLPGDLAPGAAATVSATFNVPATAAIYLVRWDLLQNGAWWSSLTGAPPRDEWFAAIEWDTTWVSANAPATLSVGQTVPVSVTVKNTGGRVWPAQYVKLSYHWISDVTQRTVVWNGNRASFAADVQPGQQVTATINVAAPTYPTRYRLQFDLVWEGAFWFTEKGVEPFEKIVNVPFDFAATYQAPASVTVRPGLKTTVPVTVTNTGSSTWPAAGLGQVTLGTHWFRDGQLEEWDGERTLLPRDIGPGQSVTLQANLEPPTTTGAHIVRWDLVLEGVAWFSNRGIVPAATTVEVKALVYGARYQPGQVGAIAAAAQTTVPVTVTNTGDFPWTPGTFNLAYHAFDAAGKLALWDGKRTALPTTVQPGQSVTLQAALTLPSTSGSYTVKWDMVHEGIAWFSDKGVPPAAQDVIVGTLRYGAAYNTVLTPTTMSTAMVWTVGVYVSNTSNFTFTSGLNVFLAYHWYDASGNTVVWDGKRSPLSVRAGETQLVMAEVTGPPRPGSYRLVFELVHEGVAWFRDKGAAPAAARAVNVVVPDYGAVYQAPGLMSGGASTTITVPVTVTNTGAKAWSNAQVFLAYHLYRNGALFVWDGARSALPSSLAPGQSATVNAMLRVPASAGSYEVRFDLVQEGVTWFSGQGVPVAHATLEAQ